MRSSLSASIKYATDESEVIWLKAIIATKRVFWEEKTDLTYLSVFVSIPRSHDMFFTECRITGARLTEGKFITNL
jgi:hypothetical protein